MQGSAVTVQRQRLASLNGTAHGSRQHASAAGSRVRASAAAESKQGNGMAALTMDATMSEHLDTLLPGQPGYITEEHLSYLSGGPFNRFALALKSGLDNEIDWACARLVAATHLAHEQWSLAQHAPSLLEAVLRVLERSRKELQAVMVKGKSKYQRVCGDVQLMVLGDSGQQMMGARAMERAGLLATVLFNMSQVGDGASLMAQDPRLMIEVTHWMHAFPGDVPGLSTLKAEFLDTLDTVLPFTAQPPFDSATVHKWPVFGSAEAMLLDPLVLVETCLWEELVRLVCESQERRLVVGAMRVMVQSVAWHPQLAREILELPVPRWAMGAAHRFVGEMVNQRLAELVLAPDAELVGVCLELLVNTVRLEAMARALDEELQAWALKKASGAKTSRANGAGGLGRRKRLRGMSENTDVSSGGESGAQTPVFGFRPLSRTSSSAAGGFGGDPSVGSEPSMLPDGLAALVALVLQQWAAAASAPISVPMPPPETKKSSEEGNVAKGPGTLEGSQGMSAEQVKAAAGRPPTEPELREACTWVLLNYEFVPPMPQQQQQPAQYVAMADLFARYVVAKEGQTVPHIGRALTLSEMVRVVAAVFPKSTLHNIGNQQQPQQQQRQASDVYVALHLRAKAQHIVPIPAVSVDAAQQQKQQQQQKQLPQTNVCRWTGCTELFTSEEQAAAHVIEHANDADACRWRGCNRVPGPAAGSCALDKWISHHVLVHGPFYTATEAKQQQQQQQPSVAESRPDLFAVAQQVREEKNQQLTFISPALVNSGGAATVDQLTRQGIQVLEQLQKWADRRAGVQGEADRARVWRSGADVLDRVAFVAAQNSAVAQFASRLLAVISKPNAM